MNILILGSGGREHALAWRLSQDLSCSKVYVWPGNDGMDGEKIQTVKLPFNKEALEVFLKTFQIKLVIPGAEKFLYEGISDWCGEFNVPCFGPSKNAAILERSKIFSKNVMIKAGIPTAHFKDLTDLFNQDVNHAIQVLKEFKRPVIKISGPSLGKGVFVCENFNEAREVLLKLKQNPLPGMEEGLMVEEAVLGNEISVFFACHGLTFSYLGSAQDHKRLLDADKGPNTGGMGAISPVPWADEAFIKKVSNAFLLPALKAMDQAGNSFKGILFLGLMVEGESINLLEYNVRFGDPETQVILPLIEGDLTLFLKSFSDAVPAKINLKKSTAVHVVKAARGYPGNFGDNVEKGQPIQLQYYDYTKSQLFFGGVKRKNNILLTDGGRVLGMTAWSDTAESAKRLVYKSLESVYFIGEQFRRDIGKNI
jgi:phosphoribosylamine--glycine ligase